MTCKIICATPFVVYMYNSACYAQLPYLMRDQCLYTYIFYLLITIRKFPMGYSNHPRNTDYDRVLSHDQCNELRCYQEREFSTYWHKCDGAVVWSTFFCHLCMISMAPLESKKVHQKETILNCWTKLAVKIAVCLICACWLANHDIPKLKSQQH